MIYDVTIIGAGVTGALTARELSKYDVKVCLVERDTDAAAGTSKANSGIIHSGYDARPGSLKARLNVRGNEMMDRISRELDVPFKRIGSLVLAFHETDLPILSKLHQQGIQNHVKDLEVLDKERTRLMEPALPDTILGALFAPAAGIICPYGLTIGAVENAVRNGVALKLDSAVEGISKKERLFHIRTDRETILSRFVVNAAGVYADAISSMVGDDQYSITPRKGEYLLLDKNQGKLVSKVIFQPPGMKGKGILVTPTVDGNLLIGPNANEVWDREDTSTTSWGLHEIIQTAAKSVPGLNIRQGITSFAGLRATTSCHDFIIQESETVGGFIHAAGIESPGLTAAPAIAEYITKLLEKAGLPLSPKTRHDPYRKSIHPFRDMTDEEREAVIKQNKQYGKIVCRCEIVTEGEIVESINRPAGARTLDGVKRRTRAGMGRCQGGFCTPGVMKILSRELGIPLQNITKMGGGSEILTGKTK